MVADWTIENRARSNTLTGHFLVPIPRLGHTVRTPLLPKQNVAGSNPVSRSKLDITLKDRPITGRSFCMKAARRLPLPCALRGFSWFDGTRGVAAHIRPRLFRTDLTPAAVGDILGF